MKILHKTVLDTSSHSGIFDIGANDIVQELIAETILKTYPATKQNKIGLANHNEQIHPSN